jgi:anti-sigma B factor antagonist
VPGDDIIGIEPALYLPVGTSNRVVVVTLTVSVRGYLSAEDVSPATFFGITASANGALVTVCGEVDLLTAPRLGRALEAAATTRLRCGHHRVVLDVSAVTFMDASGLRVLVSAMRRLTSSGGSLTLRCPTPEVRRLLSITGLTDFLPEQDRSLMKRLEGGSSRIWF